MFALFVTLKSQMMNHGPWFSLFQARSWGLRKGKKPSRLKLQRQKAVLTTAQNTEQSFQIHHVAPLYIQSRQSRMRRTCRSKKKNLPSYLCVDSTSVLLLSFRLLGPRWENVWSGATWRQALASSRLSLWPRSPLSARSQWGAEAQGKQLCLRVGLWAWGERRRSSTWKLSAYMQIYQQRRVISIPPLVFNFNSSY